MADEAIASEAASKPAVVVDAETAPPENDAVALAADGSGGGAKAKGGGGKGGGGKGKKRREQKEQVPIEELYDLTKPIKRIERPSREKHEAELAAIDEAVDALRARRKSLQSRIDEALGENKNSPLSEERDKLNTLKNRKGLMIEQKRRIRARLEAARADADRLSGRGRGGGGPGAPRNPADIDKEIARLQRLQETSSMSLGEEKRLLKELESLQASKRTAQELRAKHGDPDAVREEKRAAQAELNAKDREIDGIQKEIDAQAATVKELSEQQSSQRGAADGLMKEREELRVEIDAKFKEKNELRDQFREGTDDWYQNQRAVKAQRQLQYDEEKKKREEEKKAWLKKKEEEELAKTPYEEEMALCDYLADYLTKAYLTDGREEAERKAKAAEERAKADVVAVKDDPFAGFKAMGRKKGDDKEDIYFGKGKGGGKKKGKSKKAKQPASISLSLDLYDQFGMLSLSPPTSMDAVSASVDELRAKKQWYSEQPRGSVPTARDVRKANEEAAAKARKEGSNGKGGNAGGGKKNNGKFDISDSSQFVPLGAGATPSGAETIWGLKDGDNAEEPSS